MYLELLEELVNHRGYELLRKIGNGVAFEAYRRLISGRESKLDVMAYHKGMISGITELFSNVESFKDECRTFVEEYKEGEE